ncbi:MAG: hypothetical protein ACOC33_01225 [bacterium]
MDFKELIKEERKRKIENGEIPNPDDNKRKLLELQSALDGGGVMNNDFIDKIKAVSRKAAEKKGESLDSFPVPKKINNNSFTPMTEELDRDEKMFKDFQNKQNNFISEIKNKQNENNPYFGNQNNNLNINYDTIKKIVYEVLEEKLEGMVEELIKDTIVNMHIKESNKKMVLEILRELKNKKK